MGKTVKIILLVISAMVFLAIIAVVTASFFVDPNHFKPEIAAAVKEKTGRELTLTGELKLSIFPWLGVSTGKMALGNAAGFQDHDFATLDESDIKVKLLPLLSKKIEISRMAFIGLVLNLAKNPQGISNWADLTAANASKTTPSPSIDSKPKPDTGAALAILAIGGIALENAQINWDDQHSGKHLLIKDVNLSTDKFSFNEPVAVNLSLLVLNPETKFTGSIKLTTGLTVNEKLDTILLSHSNLQATTEGEKIPGKTLTTTLTAADTALDMTAQTAKVSGLQIKSGDVSVSADITGSNIIEKPAFQGPVTLALFSPAKVMKQLGVTAPAMQDANALSKLAASFNLQATENSVELQNLVMTLDDTLIKGSFNIKDFSQSVIAFNLAADALDVDRYLSPVTDKTPKPLTSPAVALAAGFSALPVETIRKLNVNGQLSLGRLKINGLTMQDIQLNLSAKNGIIKTQQSAKEFYQGLYNGDLNVDLRNPTSALALNEKISHAQIEPLLKDVKGETRISGVVDASTQLQGQGNNASELKSSLNGSVSFLFKDSVIKGFNLQKMIDQAKALIKEPASPANDKNDQTLFSKITGTATISNGLIQNNDLLATASKIHINGKGSADLNTEKLDYKMNARFVKSEASPTEPEQLHDPPINITVAGTFNKPTYSLNAAALLNDKNKAKIESFVDKNQEKIDKALDKLDKKLGPGVGDLLKGFLKKHSRE